MRKKERNPGLKQKKHFEEKRKVRQKSLVGQKNSLFLGKVQEKGKRQEFANRKQGGRAD